LKQYKRQYPLFSLCGLNCGLCPRYHTDGTSKCPGCGGQDFHLKHPTCPVITCNRKHDNVEYCFQCSSYPCEKYSRPSEVDSFISYRNVLDDFEKAKRQGLNHYVQELDEKVEILASLINNYNDGRNKGFYCIAVNLLKLDDIKNILVKIHEENEQNISVRDKIKRITLLLEAQAKKDNITLKLRK
jgi:hypothetical protein